MGALIKVQGADYSAKAVGKYDGDFYAIRQKDEDGVFEDKYYMRKSYYDVSHIGNYSIGLDGSGKIHLKLKFAIASFNNPGSIRGGLFQVYSSDGFGIAAFFDLSEHKLYANVTNGTADTLTSALSGALAASTVDTATNTFTGTIYTLDIWLKSVNGAYVFDKVELNGTEVSFTTTARSFGGAPDADQLIIACQEYTSAGATRSDTMLGGLLIEKNGTPVSLINMTGDTDTSKITDKVTGGVITTELSELPVFYQKNSDEDSSE